MNERCRESPIQPLSKKHAAAAARLHREQIDTGFLSTLGHGFLKQLYAAIPSCPSGFGFVWIEPDGEVAGFIACAESTGRLYKQSLLRRGVLMAIPLVRFVVRPAVMKRMWQTLRYPAEVAAELPRAEVLSIAVAPDARGKGIGKALMRVAMDEFAGRGIGRVRVAVWAGNDPANAFYKRCGFVRACTREHHGKAMNIYVAETGAIT